MKKSHRRHAIILLASGLSQRLGTSKQLLTFKGQSLLQIMIMQALATQPTVLIVVTPRKNDEIKALVETVTDNQLPSALRHSPWIHNVINPSPEAGMGHSLYLAIERLRQLYGSQKYSDLQSWQQLERVLIMGVDQILLRTEHLNNLLMPKTEVVVSRYFRSYEHLQKSKLEDRGTDLDKIIGIPIAVNLSQLLQWQPHLAGDTGLRYLIRNLADDKISMVDNTQLSLDIDTPQQLKFAINQGYLD